MRKIILASTLAAMLSFTAYSQTFSVYPGQYSLENFETAGLFFNAIDSSFSLGNSFGSVKMPFLFAGASGNPRWMMNVGSTTSGFSGGYYQPGRLPFSVYTTISGIALATAQGSDGTTNTYANAIVGPTTYQYLSTSSTVTYAQPSALSYFSISLQSLVKIGAVTTGLYFAQSGDWSAIDGDSAFYASTTKTTNYNSTPGFAPTATLDFTTTTKADNIDAAALPALGTTVAIGTSGANSVSNGSFFYVPFAFALGKIQQFGFVQLVLSSIDGSGSYSSLETSHASTAVATITDRDVTIGDTTSNTMMCGTYNIVLPGFFLSGKGAELSAGLSLTDIITAQDYGYADTAKLYNGTVVNAKTATSGYFASASATYKAANYFDLAAFIAHTLPLLSSDTVSFLMKPTAILQYTNDNNTSTTGGILSSSVRYTEGLDSTFAYDSGIYHKYLVTVTGTPATSSTFGVNAKLPMAFEIKPKGWPIGFYAGATPAIQLSWVTTTTANRTTVTEDQTITAGAVTATTTVYSNSSPSGAISTQLTPTFGETHSFGIFMPLGADLRLDIDLNGNNLLFWENLRMQLYVPLGK